MKANSMDRREFLKVAAAGTAHDDFLPGTSYAEWYDDLRNLKRTGLGPVIA